MHSVFVTGGTGFIGSHLVEELLRRGVGNVRCLVRSEKKWLEGLPIETVAGDLFDEELIEEAVRDVDVVFHNAGVTRAREWETFRRTNVDAAVNLATIIGRVNPGLGRFVVTSSLAAVGNAATGVADEDTPLQPISLYGRSKAAMERALSRFADIPTTIIRPPAVYGPREADIYTMFKAMSRGLYPVVGSVRDPALSLVYVADLVRGMVDAAEAPNAEGGTYFLGSETFYSWNDVKGAATKILGHPVLTIAVPPAFVVAVGALAEAGGRISGSYPPLNREKAREIRDACKMCSIRKAKREFGYSASTPLAEGIATTIAWYREHGWL